MPSSVLEDRLRKQLAALGETASDTDIARLLGVSQLELN